MSGSISFGQSDEGIVCRVNFCDANYVLPVDGTFTPTNNTLVDQKLGEIFESEFNVDINNGGIWIGSGFFAFDTSYGINF